MTYENVQTLDRLPEFPADESEKRWPGLSVSGLVERPLVLYLRDFRARELATVEDDFQCDEGWVVRDQRWEGVPVARLLEEAGVSDAAEHVLFASGDFSISLSMEQVRMFEPIVALRLNGSELPEEHGGPCRLVVPGQSCFTSVKWLDRIEATEEEPETTGRDIAMARIQSSPKE